MSCKCAKPTDEYHGWECDITDGACAFLFPDSKACAIKYGEGPDVDKLGFLEGMEEKFIVIKLDDSDKYLSTTKLRELGLCLESITAGRRSEGKVTYNRYLVINVDETYAPEIVEILKRNGHWG
jgi:hypothetical protein